MPMKDRARLNSPPPPALSFSFFSLPAVLGMGGTTKSEDRTPRSLVLRLKSPARDVLDLVARLLRYTPPFAGAAAPGGRVGPRPGASGVVGELVELAEDEGEGGLRVVFVDVVGAVMS